MEATLSQELRDYLRAVVEEDEERKRDHLCWLDENPNEPDRDQQRAETNRAVELARKALAALETEPTGKSIDLLGNVRGTRLPPVGRPFGRRSAVRPPPRDDDRDTPGHGAARGSDCAMARAGLKPNGGGLT